MLVNFGTNKTFNVKRLASVEKKKKAEKKITIEEEIG